MYAQVVIDSRARVLDKLYTYIIPPNIKVNPGDEVEVSFGKREKEKAYVLYVTETISEEVDKDKLKSISKVNEKELFNSEIVKVIEFIRRRYLSTYLEAIRLFIPREGKHKIRQVLKTVTRPLKNEDWIKLYDYIEKMEKNGGVIKSEAVKAGFSSSSINTLIKKGNLTVVNERDLRIDKREYDFYKLRDLTFEQEEAFRKIIESNKTTVLLHGVTGSGKTEVFLRVVGETLKKGEDSIILVPEIALTPQLVERVKGRFGSDVSIYHSGLNEGEKYDEWMRVKEGKVKIAIGARSALFLPFKNLKTIVIDEEHETSYKSETNPKYKTGETAEFMMEQRGGKLLLCSATPSLESYKNASDGIYELVVLKERPGGGKLPEVKIVDLREELRNGNRSFISYPLKKAMDEALDKKEQIILFLNRRGMSGFVSCRNCGFVYKCKNCSVSLTKHRGNRLICHHCGHMEFQNKVCPQCGSKYIKEFGLGTEKVEEEIKNMYEEARVIRMDRDTTGNKDSYETIYRTFKERKADILIGTQMVAKGLDFDNVSLVGIISADLSMNMPDFRAYEKTFQLLTQVSGRAGRNSSKGKVIIQTYDPENYPVVTSSKNDYIGFYKRESLVRKAMKYPPYGNLLTVVISSKDEEKLKKKMEIIGKDIKEEIKKFNELNLLGPTPCLIGRLKEYYRYQIIIKGLVSDELARSIKDLTVNHLKDGDYRLSMDLNPEMIL